LSYKKRLTLNENIISTYNLLLNLNLKTICVEGNCPNIGECFSKGKMTFLILGNICTRNCLYCSVDKAKIGQMVDDKEIESIKEVVNRYNLEHIIVTSVTRDDLVDGGSSYYTKLAKELREFKKELIIEVLTPDFDYKKNSIKDIVNSDADILSHNIELAKSVYKKFRPTGSYKKSLKLLKSYANSQKESKSAFILGFGESLDDIKNTIKDIADCGVDYLSIGQYLAPTKKHKEPIKYYTHTEFNYIREWTIKNFNFKKVDIGFYSRSSYMDIA